jgi:hypothetical protein
MINLFLRNLSNSRVNHRTAEKWTINVSKEFFDAKKGKEVKFK